ncbi:MAG: sodium-dependent bicarbonate transport family permease [Verrucomicrobiota bacterium]|nr:sodium-dependent bicarbonate transport family permease [Limisphaera sp.]MDW8380695.1 sodium-dependent bicarbonate transport family permease [Verrucomicrobiota bacterium]
MDLWQSIRLNVASPPLLFFALGVVSVLLRADLRLPEPVYVLLSTYLLMAIGFKGGVALNEAGFSQVWLPAVAAVALGVVIPLWCYGILRMGLRLSAVDAAAIGAHYGSVSAVTFVTALQYLASIQIPYENYASAFLAVMESPAIVVGVLLGRWAGQKGQWLGPDMRRVLHEALLGRSVFLLVGSLLAGFICGSRGAESTHGFFVMPFEGVLTLFLFEMGMVAARRLGDLRRVGVGLVAFGLVMPVLHGAVGMVVGHWSGLSPGGSFLMAVLAASASYIAAPAAMRLALPEANPTLYLTASLAVTFPFNVTLGLPLYAQMVRWWLGTFP